MASKASSPLKRTFVTILKYGAYAGLVGLVALIVAVGIAMSQLPSYSELVRRDDLGQMIRVRANDGTVIVSLGPSFGEWLSFDEIPPIMREAMVAVEDRRFRSHPGVDPIGIARALKVRVDRGSWVQGGSTITQQLARNIFLTNNRTFGRKVKEAILAMALEQRFTKDQILELYLNRVYFGGGAYGIDAASRRFFGHSATDLSLSEAAIIAGLVQPPSNYSPPADAEPPPRPPGLVTRLRPLRHRCGLAALLWPQRDRPQPVRSRHHRRPRQSALQLFADRRCRSRARPRRRCHRADAGEWRHHTRRGRLRRTGGSPDRADPEVEQLPLFHRLGAASARHDDRRDGRAYRGLDDARP